jgi:hypothetical protein
MKTYIAQAAAPIDLVDDEYVGADGDLADAHVQTLARAYHTAVGEAYAQLLTGDVTLSRLALSKAIALSAYESLHCRGLPWRARPTGEIFWTIERLRRCWRRVGKNALDEPLRHVGVSLRAHVASLARSIPAEFLPPLLATEVLLRELQRNQPRVARHPRKGIGL